MSTAKVVVGGAAMLVALAMVGASAWTSRSPRPPEAHRAPGGLRSGHVGERPIDASAAWQSRLAATSADDLGGLLLEALGLDDRAVRGRAVRAVLRRWLRHDAAGGADFLDALAVRPDGEETWVVLAPVLADLLPRVRADPARADALRQLTLALVRHLATTDPDAALAWSRAHLGGDAWDAAAVMVAGELAHRAPDRAIALLPQIAGSYRRLEALADIGEGYGAVEPERAVAWVATLPRQPERVLAMEGILESMARTHPASAAAVLTAFERTLTPMPMYVESDDASGTGMQGEQRMLRNDHLANVAALVGAEWARHDPAAAVGWARALDPGLVQRDALRGALVGWSVHDPAGAAAWAVASADLDARTLQAVFGGWATRAPEAAGAAALGLDDLAQRAHAVLGVVDRWAVRDPARAGAWVEQLPAGWTRDAALVRVVNAGGLEDPNVAWGLALAVEDPTMRREALGTAFAALVASDPAWAGTLLQHAALTPGEQRPLARMLAAVAPPGR